MAKKEVLQKLTAGGWNWNSPVMFVVGVAIGMIVTMYWKGAHDAAMVMMGVWRSDIIGALVIIILLGRMVAVARLPRSVPLDYNKLTWAGFWSANLVTITIAGMLLLITASMFAPGAIKELIKILGDK